MDISELAVAGQTVHVFDMPDRRADSGSSQPTRWTLQMELEEVLYGNTMRSTGAMYRLLERTPNAKGRADTAIEDVKTFLETNAGDADLAGELGAPVVEAEGAPSEERLLAEKAWRERSLPLALGITIGCLIGLYVPRYITGKR